MRKLEDFECEKVEIKSIHGGQLREECPDTCTIVTSTGNGKNDGPDCE